MKTSIVILLFFVLAAPNLFASPAPLVVDLYPGDAPGLVPGGKPETVENSRISNVSKPQLNVWLPAPGHANGVGLIICPGGGYGFLAMKPHVENVVDLLTAKGFAVIALKYRTHYGQNDYVEDSLADGKRAVRITRSRAKEWGLNPDRIGVQGYSAGANLCLNLAARFDAGDAQATDPVQCLSSRPNFIALMSTWPNKKTIDDFPLRKDSPPIFLAHARNDTTAPFEFAEAIDAKLTALSVPHTFLAVDAGGHGAFHYQNERSPGHGWPDALVVWLQSVHLLS